jgi:hypothetical protein
MEAKMEQTHFYVGLFNSKNKMLDARLYIVDCKPSKEAALIMAKMLYVSVQHLDAVTVDVLVNFTKTYTFTADDL